MWRGICRLAAAFLRRGGRRESLRRVVSPPRGIRRGVFLGGRHEHGTRRGRNPRRGAILSRVPGGVVTPPGRHPVAGHPVRSTFAEMSFPASTGTGRGEQTSLVTGNALRAGLFGILRFQRRGIRRLAAAFLRHGGSRESLREVATPAKRHPRGRNPRQKASAREIRIFRSGPYSGGPAPESATQHEDTQREGRHEDESDPERGHIRDQSH